MGGSIKAIVVSTAAAVALACLPSAARAQGYVNPWAGVQFGSNVENGRGSFGVSAGGMSAGVIGGELDFGYSPSFFGTQNDFGHNTVINLMGNVIVGVPINGTRGGSVRPYVTAGLGLIRTQIDGGRLFKVASSDNELGWSAGAGVMGFFTDHVGLRGDARYLRRATGNVVNGIDLGTLNFWRLSAGVVVH
jgi:opacity protein-like surface antigen